MKLISRIAALLMAGAVVCSTLPANAWAVEATETEGLCEHHPEHTAECGYAPAEPGQLCTFVCEICNSQEGGEPADKPQPDEDECVCAELCTEDQVNADCPVCSAESADLNTCKGQPVQEEAECICETLCTADAVNADCPVCGSENADLTKCEGKEVGEQVKAVQAQIDALPSLEDIQAMSPEEQQKAHEKVQAAYDAYNALTDEQKAQITGAEIFESLFAFFNGLTNTVETLNDVEYLDENGEEQTADNVAVIDNQTAEWSGGWYVVNSNVTIESRVAVTGDVHLILADGNTLTAKSGIGVAGESNSLTIYGQTGGTGKLIATGISRAAGIGGNGEENTGSIVINGGTVTATGGSSGAGIGGGYKGAGGTVTINGGTINATGGSGGAGIGGGYKGERGSHDTITINGGTVTAKAATGSAEQGAGIGAGSDDIGGDIIITGGIVTATGNDGGGAGIGAGYCVAVGSTKKDGKIGDITITGGVVNASGGRYSAGIGYGNNCKGVGDITISGGAVTATGNNTDGIRGYDGSTFSTEADGSALILASSISDQFSRENWSGIIFEGNAGQLYGNPALNMDAAIPSGKILTIPENSVLTIGSGKTLTNNGTIGAYGEISGTLTNHGTIMVGPDGSVPSDSGGSVIPFPYDETYLDASGTPQNIPTTGTRYLLPEMSVLTGGWYVVRVDVTLPERLTVTGDVHLILMDGCKLDAQEGITVNESDSLTIYAQSNDEAQMGVLTATSSDTSYAGIGGDDGAGGTITINGGKITAAGQNHNFYGSAGIGGGNSGAGGVITINNGIVNATGGSFSAGIGGGNGGSGGTIQINGGTVTATGGNDGAGIGGGRNGAAGTFAATGNVFIIASSISDNGEDKKANWSGVIFEGDEGQVYGAPTLKTAETIPGGKRLEIPAGKTLTIDNNVTLTNNGVIGVYGTISGSLTNNGTIMVGPDGKIPEGTADIVIPYPSNRTYLDKDGVSQNIPANAKFLLPGTATLRSGWYVVFGNIILPERLTVTGDVHLVLIDGCKLDAPKGITVASSDSLTIYAQSSGSNMGALTATGGDFQAGIGGEDGGAGGTITVNGGTVTATGKRGSAGIGGGYNGAGGIITVNGGTVTATGKDGGAGIGGGYNGAGGTITVNGGTVVAATAGGMGAGIGGGNGGAGGAITVNGGNVTATGKNGGAGIGGGYKGAGGAITISGGTVTATGKIGAGIGSGRDGTGGTFTTGQNGNAFIIASSISDNNDTAGWNGVIFQGDSGQVYGNSFTLTTDAEIPSGKTLEIEVGKTVTIDSGVTLTNNGTITGTGTLTGRGTLTGSGTIAGTIKNDFQKASSVIVSFEGERVSGDTVSYGFSITIKATVQQKANVLSAQPNTVDFYLGDPQSGGQKLNETPISVVDNTATLNNVAIQNGQWTTGTNTIYAVYGGSMTLKPETGSAQLTVTGDLKDAVVTVDDKYVYTGSPITPDVSVMWNGTKLLTSGTDYTLSYADNTNVGTATVTVTGKGNYTGTATTTFTIAQSATEFESGVTVDKQDKTYTYGDTITVTVTPKATGVAPANNALVLTAPVAGQMAIYEGDRQLTEAKDVTSGSKLTFTIDTAEANLGSGKHTLTAKFVGSDNMAAQTGTVEVTVNPASISGAKVMVSGGPFTYDGNPKTPAVTVELNGTTLTSGTDYTFSYTDNTNVGTATVNAAGTGNYTGTATGTFTIAPASYKITLTGQADSPTKITLNEAVVEPGDTGAAITYGYNTLNEAPDNWQTGREFSGLAANTTYYFFAKAAASSNYAETISQGVAITTPEKAVSRIEITAQPANLSYTSGQTLDLSGLSVQVYYNDNTNETLTWASGKLTAAPAQGMVLTVAEHNGKTVTISYGGKTAQTDVLTVGKAAQAALFITGAPSPIYEGSSFTLQTSGGSGTGAVTWSVVSGPATVDANGSVTVTGTGDFHIKAVKAADVEYNQAEAVITLTAAKKPSGGGHSTPTYRPDVEKPEHGEVSVAPKNPEKGDKVTIQPTPDEGYEVDHVAVTDKNGKPVEVEQNKDGTWSFKQPSGKVTVEVTFKPIETKWRNPFPDVSESDWFYDAVRYVYEKGLMAGTSENTFSPNVITNRGMIATILYRLAGSPDIEDENWGYPYADVDANAYYGTAVYWARLNGIASGYSDERFGPDDSITREQLAVMLYRFAKAQGHDVTARADLSGYTDAGQISGFAREAMSWASAEGLINGTSGSTLSPGSSATRAQVAVILMRFASIITE